MISYASEAMRQFLLSKARNVKKKKGGGGTFSMLVTFIVNYSFLLGKGWYKEQKIRLISVTEIKNVKNTGNSNLAVYKKVVRSHNTEQKSN